MKKDGKIDLVVLVMEVVIMTITEAQNAVLVMAQEKRSASQMVYNNCIRAVIFYGFYTLLAFTF